MRNILLIISILSLFAGFVNPEFFVIAFFAWGFYALSLKPSFAFSLLGCDAGDVLRECDDCPEEERNKLIHVAFVKKSADSGITLTDPASIITDLKTAELACNAYIVRNISGTYDGGTLSEGQGAGKQTTRILGGQHIITIIDFNYTNNVAFWNNFKRISQNYYMYYFTDTYAWKVNKPVTVMPQPAITDDINTFIEASVQIKWSSKDNPVNYKADVDDLESCQELFEFSELSGWTQTSGSMAAIVGTDITADSGDAIYVTVDAGVDLESAELKEGSLPDGIELSVSGQNIVLSGSSTATGSYEVTIRAINACGVGGEFESTVIIE